MFTRFFFLVRAGGSREKWLAHSWVNLICDLPPNQSLQAKDEVELFGSKYSIMADKGGGGDGDARNTWDVASSLNRSTALLENSMRVISDTEAIGDSVASDMESQRSQLMNAHEKVAEMRIFTGDARAILRRMGNRATMEKCALITIIFGLLISIGLVVYYRFLGGGHHNKH